MKLFYLVAALTATAQASVMPELLIKRTSCSSPYGSGTCVSTSSCGGFHVSGYCPGSAEIQCCISEECSTSKGTGVCRNTGYGCSGGSFVAGACPGDSSIQCCVGPSCSTSDGSGTCKDTSACGTFSESGACPGPSSFQCCISKSCSTPKGSGSCKSTSKGCSGGSFLAGYCPGASDVQCCVANAPAPPPTTTPTKPTPTPSPSPTSTACAVVAGFDSSALQTAQFWIDAKKTKTKAVIRGYTQACGVGGAVDANFATNYKNAKAAGFTSIDAYMYPCSGTLPAGCGYKACKPAATQFQEFEAAIAASGMTPGHLWLDIESGPTTTVCGKCNTFNLGTDANRALAGQFVDLMRKSKYKWGVYANAGSWPTIFGTEEWALAPDLPLWAVDVIGEVPGVATKRLMGGWTSAYAKQYTGTTTLDGGGVDLDSFCG